MIPYCLHKGIGLIPYAPLAVGHLARPFNEDKTLREKTSVVKHDVTDSDKEIIRRVEALANKYHVPMAQIAIAWAMNKISSPIIGMSSVRRRLLLWEILII